MSRASATAVLVLLAACAGTGVPGAPKRPLQLEEEVADAARVAAEQRTLVLRYNPVSCACPPFEIQLGARWVRLELRDTAGANSPGALLLARARADLEGGSARHYRVTGDLDDSLNRCGQGTLFLTLSPSSAEAQ